MLVLTRRPHEVIVIADDIFIKVLSVEGNQVKLGFDAPKEINIVREELLERDRLIEELDHGTQR